MRVVAIAALLMTLGLAGCASVDDPVDDVLDDVDQTRELVFRQAKDLGSKAGPMDLGVGGFGTSCQDSLDDGDCGLGEPSIEVDGAGTIYVSGVCCLTTAPPVYVSRDGGETFTTLDTPGIREAFGIEGDFAIDGEGRVYFSDIEFAGTFQITVWDKDGNFLHHTKWPAPPLVDRDWIRAEGDGTAYYVYNTGAMGTRVYKSTDHGLTWSPDAIHVVPYALGNVAIDPGVELCLFGGNIEGKRSVDCSQDGGATWSTEPASLPRGDDAYPVGSYDEAGNLWLGEMVDRQLHLSHRSPDGAWHDVFNVTDFGHHRMPWIAAGPQDTVAAAWYGTNDTEIGPATEWHVWTALVTNASSPDRSIEITIADPEPVFIGELGRDLLDFLQVDVGPDGAIHIAYSKLPGTPGQDGNEEQLTYVRTDPIAALAMETFWLGP